MVIVGAYRAGFILQDWDSPSDCLIQPRILSDDVVQEELTKGRFYSFPDGAGFSRYRSTSIPLSLSLPDSALLLELLDLNFLFLVEVLQVFGRADNGGGLFHHWRIRHYYFSIFTGTSIISLFRGVGT